MLPAASMHNFSILVETHQYMYSFPVVHTFVISGYNFI